MTDIRLGELGERALLSDYRAEMVGEVLIERAVWGDLPAPRSAGNWVVADSGYIWFRFWLFAAKQVVERYYDASGRLLGTHIDVCAPPKCDDNGCRARDLMLDIRVDPDGRVTLENEAAFERAIVDGALKADDAELAERHVRELTGAIAAARFPPALVRNWQVDPQRVRLSVKA